MEKRRLWASLFMTAFTLVVLCATLTVSTYAWFTFDPFTNVTPMEGKISDGDTNLLISESKDGPFDKKCGLNPTSLAKILQPVSTLDLNTFYASSAQNRDGISTNYKNVTEKPEDWLIQGTVYLQCLGSGCNVYFDKDTLNLGEDIQILAAGRLGLKMTDADGKTETLLFRLDSLGDTAGAESRRTVSADKEVVVGGINADNTPNYENDPAASIGDYMLTANDTKKNGTIRAGEKHTAKEATHVSSIFDFRLLCKPVNNYIVTVKVLCVIFREIRLTGCNTPFIVAFIRLHLSHKNLE